MRAAQFLAIIGRGSKGSNALELTEERAAVTAESQDNIINRVNNVSQYGPSWHYVPGIGVAGTAYAEVPGTALGDLAYSRASSKTRTNAAGVVETIGNNVPPHDYRNADGTLSTFPRLNPEPQRTNLALHSEDFTNAVWNKDGVTATANVVTSPDGYQNADSIVENTATSGHRTLLTAGISGTGSSAYSFSVYVKKIEGQPTRHIYWMCQISANAIYAHFNMTTFTVNQVTSNGNGSGASASITPVGNNWYRLSLSGVVSTTTAQYFNQIYLETTPRTGFSSEIYTGNGTSGYYVWGWQQEAGAYPSTYIPTTTAAVTRVADGASKTGVSSLIGQSEGTLFFDGIVNNTQNTTSNIFNTNKSPNTISSIALTKVKAISKIKFEQFLGNGTFSNISLFSTNTFADGARTKVAIRYKSGDFAMYINGVLEATSTSTFTNVGIKSEIYLNDTAAVFAFQESVSFNQAALFTRVLTNTELAQITTL